MLVVGDKIENDEQLVSQKNFNIDEFIWPHGITPPLHHVRKRRFRKRVNRRVCLLPYDLETWFEIFPDYREC